MKLPRNVTGAALQKSLRRLGYAATGFPCANDNAGQW